jgi:hypothetical protein
MSSFLLPLDLTLATVHYHRGMPRQQETFYQNSLVNCDSECMPADANCCHDGSGTFCPSGEYCVANSCCAKGKVCGPSGGGTATDTLTGTAPAPSTHETVAPTVTSASTGVGGASLKFSTQNYAFVLATSLLLVIGL